MNPFEFVIAIIVIAYVGRMLQMRQMAKYGMRPRSFLDWRGRPIDDEGPEDSGETKRLREEVRELKERIKVLERIAVDKENVLSREIDSLRDR